MAPLVVAVPTRGIERWIAQELSTRLGVSSGSDGIAANIVFPSPATVVDWAVGSVDGVRADLRGQRTSTSSPWDPDALRWTMLDVVAESEDLVADYGAFGAHLYGEFGSWRRMAALTHVAGLLAGYDAHRPAMLADWAAGRVHGGAGTSLPTTARWQYTLWRQVRDRVGPAPSERLAEVTEHLRNNPVPGLPPTVCIYGLTALPQSQVAVLEALSARHEVHLFVLHPSPASWSDVAIRPKPDGRRSIGSPDAVNPLLASWGRDSRELQHVLGSRADHVRLHHHLTPVEPMTVLHRVQEDIRTDTSPEDSVPLQLDEADASIQIHGCHGRIRQVDVLRDVILGLMTDDPSIQPRDIVVMCPDIETFAPLIQAIFGSRAQGSSDGLPNLRVRMADRALKATNPYLRAVADILTLPDGRFEASTALGLLRQAPVMARFALGDDDIETIDRWVEDVGIRWGLHTDHRQAHGLDVDANTWAAGLTRLLLGVAVPEDGPRLVAGVLPHDDVEGTVVRLVGVIAEFVDRVDLLVTHLEAPRPIGAWITDLRAAATLLLDAPGQDAWQAIQFGKLLDRLADESADSTVPITLPELRGLLNDDLGGRPSRENHRTGDLTVCTLVPMRSVPYRVVCLLGMDDDAFPRRSTPFGDDLLAAASHIGDHDPRTEDRHMLLDALMAARDHLVVLYRSHDERTGASLPPAVPIAELLDVIDATAVTEDGTPVGEQLVCHHPLHAADPRSFTPPRPFGFDPLALAGAQARVTPPVAPAGFRDALPGPLVPVDTVAWSELVGFMCDPVGTYLRERLDVRFPRDESPTVDLLSTSANALEQWQIGTRLLEGALRGGIEGWVQAERARGQLPPGQLGEFVLAELDDVRDHIVTALGDTQLDLGDLLSDRPEPVPIDLEIDGVRLVGAVEKVGNERLTRIDYGKPKPKRLLKAWLDWLILQAAGEELPAVLITSGESAGSGKNKRQVDVLTHYPSDLGVEAARERLRVLVDLYRRGLDSPAPLFETSSGVYVEAWFSDTGRSKKSEQERGDEASAAAWCGYFGEVATSANRLVFGDIDYDALRALPTLDDESGDGWRDDQHGRFARLAWRLWEPVYADRVTQGGDDD